jgi:iron(III) transport system ATP-binding protein
MLLEIRMIQKRLNATILYITHDQQSALQLCDKMAIMQQDGTLCQYGSDEEIILKPANRFTFEFIGVSNFIPLVKDGDGLKLDCGEKIPYPGEVPPEAAGGGYELGVRPNDIVFDSDSPLKARVDSRVFLGSEYNYFLSIGQKQIRVQQSMLDARTKGVAKEGETVGVRLLNARFYPAQKGAETT